MYEKEKTSASLKAACTRLSAVLLAASTLTGATLAAPATVTAQGGLRMRAQANTSSQVLSTLASGAKAEVLEALDGWYRVEANGKTGYVSGQYLKVTGIVTASTLNVRSTPSTSGRKVATLSSGAKVELLETLDGWYRIENGYISSQHVSLTQFTDTQSPAQPEHPAPAEPLYGTVSAYSLNVRSGPGSSHRKVTSLSSGTKVEILETLDGWYRIESGYISSQYVTLNQLDPSTPQPEMQPETQPASQPEVQPEPQPALQPEQTPQEESKPYGMVSASTLNVRSGPGSFHPKVGSLSAGAQVEILETLDGWYRIENGYVSADYILILDHSVSSLQAQIVAYSHTFLGCAYVYGGNGPKVFDCSGLTKYVYNHFGYSINRTATQQLKNGIPVSKENLQPGDLVFFNSEGTGVDRATHVGIYIGNGQFLHASNKRLGVTITNLSDPYRVRTYTTARRII